MSNINNINYFGRILYVDDSCGITADSATELNEKIDWCDSVGIHQDSIPIHSYTLSRAIPSFYTLK